MAISLYIDDEDVKLARPSRSAFHFTCICGKCIVSHERTGNCTGCGREFDLSAWGNAASN